MLEIEQYGIGWRLIRRWQSAARRDIKSGDILAVFTSKENAEQARNRIENAEHEAATWEDFSRE